MSDIKFKKLTMTEWKQFGNIDIDFHDNLTILTGSNGSGKTTILNLLARHFDWNFPELATPAKDTKTGGFRFFPRFFKSPSLLSNSTIGNLEYSNKESAKFNIPDGNSGGAIYPIVIEGKQAVEGVNIPSHRAVFSYRAITQLPVQKRKKRQAFDLISSSNKEKILGNGGNQPSSFYIKETLINWAIYGYGNEVVEKDVELQSYYNGFQEVLKKILPNNLGFKELSVR